MKTIKLSIQEIIEDFEKLTREDERLNVLANYELTITKDFEEYYDYTKKLCKKYIPNYKNLVPTSYHDDDIIEKGIILNSLLHKNFKEMIYQLI